jgi:hypothetical protein
MPSLFKSSHDVPGGDESMVCNQQRPREIKLARQGAQALKRTDAEKDARTGLKVESFKHCFY